MNDRMKCEYINRTHHRVQFTGLYRIALRKCTYFIRKDNDRNHVFSNNLCACNDRQLLVFFIHTFVRFKAPFYEFDL